MSESGSKVGRRNRKLKNLLIDPKFQLKYVLYFVAITIFLSGSLGLVLFSTSAEVIERSEANVRQGEQVVRLGDEVLNESRKVSAVVRMNIIRDPIYQDEPDLLEAFNQEAKEQDARLDRQKQELENQKRSLHLEAAAARNFHRTLLWSLITILSLLVIAITLAAIFVTHKIAGPIFKMKRHLRDVARGDLTVPWALRKGDELVEFFETFRTMVIALRERKQADLVAFEELELQLGPQLSEEAERELRRFKERLSEGLEASS